MTNFDGQAERDSIFERISDLCGGRVSRDILDWSDVEKNPDGTVKPYIEIEFGTPIPAARGRGLGGERVQPHIMPVAVYCIASSKTIAEASSAAVLNRLLDFAPGVNNAGALAARGGWSFGRKDTAGATTRRGVFSGFETIINLSPVDL